MISCSFEEGQKASLRHAVVDVLVIKDERLLLVKRTAKLLEGGKWALVGGFAERDEDIRQAAEREIFEETGWKVKDLHLLLINSRPDRPHEDRQNISFVFVATATEKTGEPDWESDDVQWFSFSKLPPAAAIAFDHLDYIKFYRKTQSEAVALPVLL